MATSMKPDNASQRTMKEAGYIAERSLHAVAADGNSFEIGLAIGRPYRVSTEEWACSVRVAGLHHGLSDIRGIDSWQALQLACQLSAQLLDHFVAGGGRIFWEEGGEQLSVADLFAKI